MAIFKGVSIIWFIGVYCVNLDNKGIRSVRFRSFQHNVDAKMVVELTTKPKWPVVGLEKGAVVVSKNAPVLPHKGCVIVYSADF